MPVATTLQTQSEYQRNFTASQRRVDHDNKIAGAPSEKAAKFSHPGLQSKKRIQTTSKPKHREHEYVLLGQQEKFANNVQYKSQSQNRQHRTAPLMSAGEPNGRDAPTPSDLTPPPAPRPRDPPVVNFDPGRPVFDKPDVRQLPREAQMEAKLPAPEKPRTKYGVEDVRRGNKAGAVKKVDKGVGDEVALTKMSRGTMAREHPPQGPSNKSQGFVREPVVSRGEAKVSKISKAKAVVNDSVQTDLDHGIVDSKYEAPNNYAMQYRSRIALPRPKAAARMTEYERNYVWRKSLPNTPLLAAEAVVYRSALKEVMKGDPSTDTEYNRQYRPWSLMKSTPDLTKAAAQAEQTPSVREYKSRAAARPAGGSTHVDEEDKRLVKESSNPLKLFFPHGKDRARHSEYESNYKPPWKFDVEHGAWKGASPPQLFREESEASQSARDHRPRTAGDHRPRTAPVGLPRQQRARSASPPPVLDAEAGAWFKQVTELRRRAAEYKRRAFGTHFSREHLAQLYAPREANDPWDGEPTPRDLTLPREACEDDGEDRSTVVDVGQQQLEELDGDGADTESVPGSAHALEHAGGYMKPRKEVWAASRSPSVRSMDASMRDDGSAWGVDEQVNNSNAWGSPQRANTSPVKRPSRTGSPVKRGMLPPQHHLNRTTPTRGGALINENPGIQEEKAAGSPPSSCRGSVRSPVKQSKVRCTCMFGANERSSQPSVAVEAEESQDGGGSITGVATQTSLDLSGLEKPQDFDPVEQLKAGEGVKRCRKVPKHGDNRVISAAGASKQQRKDEARQPARQVDHGSRPVKHYHKDFHVRRAVPVKPQAHREGVPQRDQSPPPNNPAAKKQLEVQLNRSPPNRSAVFAEILKSKSSIRGYHHTDGNYRNFWGGRPSPGRGDGPQYGYDYAGTLLDEQLKEQDKEMAYEKFYQAVADHKDGRLQPMTDVTNSRRTNQKKHQLRNVPTYGMPTQDTHKLLDEDAESDHTLELQYVSSKQTSPVKKPLGLSTIAEAGGETYSMLNNPPPPPTDPKLTVTLDDIPPHGSRRSISTASVASSCSLASEVLDRARRRRDQFWGKQD